MAFEFIRYRSHYLQYYVWEVNHSKIFNLWTVSKKCSLKIFVISSFITINFSFAITLLLLRIRITFSFSMRIIVRKVRLVLVPKWLRVFWCSNFLKHSIFLFFYLTWLQSFVAFCNLKYFWLFFLFALYFNSECIIVTLCKFLFKQDFCFPSKMLTLFWLGMGGKM